jgi:heptosyltransferase III
VLAVPALRALRATRPDAPLEIAAQPRLAALLVALGLADRGRSVDGLGLEELFTGGPIERARSLAHAGRVVCWFGAGDPGFVRCLTALVPDAIVAAPGARGEGPVWQQLVATVAGEAGAGVAPIDVAPALRREGLRLLPKGYRTGAGPLVIIHPGAGSVAKQWPAEGFARTVQALGVTPVVHEGPADAAAVGALLHRLGGDVHVLRDPPLPALAGALAEAALYVGNDSGVSHLAAAVGAPSVVLFRAENLAWRPWSARARVLVVSMTGLTSRDVGATIATARAALG